jgi:4'-phosphopantetheinyl transferase
VDRHYLTAYIGIKEMINKLYFLETDGRISRNKLEWFLSFVPVNKQEKIKKLKYSIDKKLSLWAELIVRHDIYKELGITNNAIEFKTNVYGKPYLYGNCKYEFNISHTRNAIAVAVSDKAIGVDIEPIRMADMRIANKFFSKDEVAYITGAEKGSDTAFYEIWTKKEAYIKNRGGGLAIPLPSFNVFDSGIREKADTLTMNNYILSICSAYYNFDDFLRIELPEEDMDAMANML